MLSCKINNLHTAYALIEHYGLQHAAWRHGSAEGFAAWLFYDMQKVKGLTSLAWACQAYQEKVKSHANKGANYYDRQLADGAASLEASLLERTIKRQALAAFVRKVKFGPEGGAIWSAVAEAATNSYKHRGKLLQANHRLLDAITQALTGLREFNVDFADCLLMPYTPGKDAWLDAMVRMDIERLDAGLLGAPQWDGGDPDIFEEVGALLKLAGDAEFQTMVDAHRGHKAPSSEATRATTA